MLAAILDIPYAAWARKLSFGEDGTLTVERLLDHGYDAVEVKLPALVTVVKEINEPRVPSFKAKLRAKKEAIPVWGVADLGLDADAGGPERLLHPGGEGLSAAGPGQIRGLDRRTGGTGRPPLAAAEADVQGRSAGAVLEPPALRLGGVNISRQTPKKTLKIRRHRFSSLCRTAECDGASFFSLIKNFGAR